MPVLLKNKMKSEDKGKGRGMWREWEGQGGKGREIEGEGKEKEKRKGRGREGGGRERGRNGEGRRRKERRSDSILLNGSSNLKFKVWHPMFSEPHLGKCVKYPSFLDFYLATLLQGRTWKLLSLCLLL
jgi:hypothetical protein